MDKRRPLRIMTQYENWKEVWCAPVFKEVVWRWVGLLSDNSITDIEYHKPTRESGIATDCDKGIALVDIRARKSKTTKNGWMCLDDRNMKMRKIFLSMWTNMRMFLNDREWKGLVCAGGNEKSSFEAFYQVTEHCNGFSANLGWDSIDLIEPNGYMKVDTDHSSI